MVGHFNTSNCKKRDILEISHRSHGWSHRHSEGAWLFKILSRLLAYIFSVIHKFQVSSSIMGFSLHLKLFSSYCFWKYQNNNKQVILWAMSLSPSHYAPVLWAILWIPWFHIIWSYPEWLSPFFPYFILVNLSASFFSLSASLDHGWSGLSL